MDELARLQLPSDCGRRGVVLWTVDEIGAHLESRCATSPCASDEKGLEEGGLQAPLLVLGQFPPRLPAHCHKTKQRIPLPPAWWCSYNELLLQVLCCHR